MKEISKYKFLKNVPIGEDLFAGKSQEKIADVLTNVIAKESFQIIGIDGKWGTGKSNLVKIIEKKLPKYNFFVYDVWGHQEDDQRKAILIELTEFVSSGNNVIADNSKWKNKLKRLLAKEKEITTINSPYLSVGFIFSLFSIVYVPSVNVFKDDMTTYFQITSLFGKLLLVLFPIFLVAGIYIFNFVNNIFSKISFFDSFKIAAQETFQVYTNKQKQETRIETISENEPSVEDFRNWMKEIDNDLKDSKLIVVFDNFDRLPKKNIVSIWSSIHIFFSEEKYKNIKVIIPFDRLHIKNAFSEMNGNDSKNEFADDYINKTFDLVYRVSPPILTDWKNFFRMRWKEAFLDFNEGEYLKVEQIYEVYRTTITPREMIACINEIVAIKLLDDNIPDRFIALFVLNKDYIIANPLLAISDAEFLKGLSYLYKDDEDFQKYITALSYQIDSKNALEVVYRKQLKDSLINENLEMFSEISKTIVFDKIISPVIGEIENFRNPILVLDTINADSKISEIEIASIWNDIYQKLRDGNVQDFELQEYQKVFIKNLPRDKAEAWIKKLVVNFLNHQDFSAVGYTRIIDELEKYLGTIHTDMTIFDLLQSKVVLPPLFLSLVSQKRESYSKYKINTNTDLLNTYLSELKLTDLQQTNYLENILGVYDLSVYVKSIENKIEEHKGDKEYISILYSRLTEVAEKPVKILLSDSEIYTMFNSRDSTDTFFYDLIAMRIAREDHFNSAYSSTFSAAYLKGDETFIEELAGRILNYMKYETFLINENLFSTSEVYKFVATEIINKFSGKFEINLEDVLINFDSITSNIEMEPQIFLDNLNKWKYENFEVKNFFDMPNILFSEAVLSGNIFSINLLKGLNNFLIRLTQQNWSEIFEDLSSDKFKLLKIISFKDWNTLSIEAFKNTLLSNIDSSNFNNISEVNSLISNIESSSTDLTHFFKDIRDKFINNGSLINKEFFTTFINNFFKYRVFEERPGDSFRTILKSDLLDDPHCANLMLKNSAQLKSLIHSVNPSEISNFKQGIRDRMENSPEILNLAKVLDIRSSKKP